MAEVIVDAGICGMITKIISKKRANGKIDLIIETPCEKLQELNGKLLCMDPMKEVFANISDSLVYKECEAAKIHLACPVPSAILKALEVEADFALPKDVHFKIKLTNNKK